MMTVKKFSKVKKIIKKISAKNPSTTLLVMDDDDTLTMISCPKQKHIDACQYLGGPAWYSWQSSLIETNSHYKVAQTSEELLDISALLLAMNNMFYVEKDIPKTLNSLSKLGVKLVVLTARGSSNLSATNNQFSKLVVENPDATKGPFNAFIKSNALVGKKSGISSIASPFTPTVCGATREVSYQNGVMYVAGQNKGEMLQCLLNRTQSSKIKNIVFIDDTLQNVVDVNASFKNNDNYNVYALHYTQLKKHKEKLTQGKDANDFQFNAHVRWESIKAILKEELIQPTAIK
jgi:hypothetical protein